MSSRGGPADYITVHPFPAEARKERRERLLETSLVILEGVLRANGIAYAFPHEESTWGSGLTSDADRHIAASVDLAEKLLVEVDRRVPG